MQGQLRCTLAGVAAVGLVLGGDPTYKVQPKLLGKLPHSCSSRPVQPVAPFACPFVQGAAARVPTWARRAWKALAVQRPELCLQLLKELVAKVRGGDDAPSASSGCGSRTYCPVLMVSCVLPLS